MNVRKASDRLCSLIDDVDAAVAVLPRTLDETRAALRKCGSKLLATDIANTLRKFLKE